MNFLFQSQYENFMKATKKSGMLSYQAQKASLNPSGDR